MDAPPPGLSSDVIYIYNMLYAMGRFPNIKYYQECQHSHMPADEAYNIYRIYFKIFGLCGEETDKIIRDYISEHATDGFLYDETQLNSALLYRVPREAALKPTVRRIVTSILCLVVVIILNFLLPRMMPETLVLMLTGIDEDAISQANKMYKEKLGLDRPLIEQFADYISDLSGGNLGYSYHYKDTVANIMAQRVPATLQVAIPTIIISSLCALFWAILQATARTAN